MHGRMHSVHHNLYNIHAAFMANKVAAHLRLPEERTVDPSHGLMGSVQLRERLLERWGWRLMPIEQEDFKFIHTYRSLKTYLVDRIVRLDVVHQ